MTTICHPLSVSETRRALFDRYQDLGNLFITRFGVEIPFAVDGTLTASPFA